MAGAAAGLRSAGLPHSSVQVSDAGGILHVRAAGTAGGAVSRRGGPRELSSLQQVHILAKLAQRTLRVVPAVFLWVFPGGPATGHPVLLHLLHPTAIVRAARTRTKLRAIDRIRVVLQLPDGEQS